MRHSSRLETASKTQLLHNDMLRNILTLFSTNKQNKKNIKTSFLQPFAFQKNNNNAMSEHV